LVSVGPLRVGDDDRLAAAEVEAGHGTLVGHPARKAQHVAQRGIGVLVLPHAGAAERGAERGVVDRDDAEVAARRFMGEDHLLVAHGLHFDEGVHEKSSQKVRLVIDHR
jgi:hypothetical protein